MIAEIRTGDVRCLQDKLNNLPTYFNNDDAVVLDELSRFSFEFLVAFVNHTLPL